MPSHETLALVESLVPGFFGTTLGILAIIGIRELIKEASMAFEKGASI